MMNSVKKSNQDHFDILRKISKKPEVSQRQLASELGFSLGKLNYCLKELQNKGLIKIQNFKKNKKKINYLYILTPQGISSKTKLTITFMQKKIKEYDELKSEIVNLDNVKINHPNNKKIDKSLL
jgi:EPS-associated MarR family transcriptional regulator|tara:strand:- start:262 stop:633 length:372 start_codon:yes stop_codon:yes gene_type:complete